MTTRKGEQERERERERETIINKNQPVATYMYIYLGMHHSLIYIIVRVVGNFSEH